MIHSELSARCDEVRGSKGSSYVGRGRRATCLGASEPPYSLTFASEVQGERRAELARAMLSRSLHSPLQLVCNGKGTTLRNPFCPQMSSYVRRCPQKSKRLTFFYDFPFFLQEGMLIFAGSFV